MERLLIFGLLVLFAAALGFLTLLILFDLSPKTAFYRLLGRFGKRPQSLPPSIPDAPYRRIRQATSGYHRPILLNLDTSEGSGQACHPDVAYISDGFGDQKWTYWMACTPYPNGNARYENPELFASHDGLNWVVPPGLTNPLVPAPKASGDHNSDPDLLFCGKELCLFYRETIRSKTPNENRICLMRSRDGVQWSSRVEILSDKSGKEMVSPSVIHDGSRFIMWTIEFLDGEFKMMRRRSQDGILWEEPLAGHVIGLPAPRHVWHVDVLQEQGRLSALIVSAVGMGGAESRIHYAHSDDGGLHWQTEDFLFEQTYEFECDLQYRASFRLRAAQPPQYELWYSARNKKQMFSVAYVQLTREQNKLLPIVPGPVPVPAAHR
jgi:hypothetical protein